MTEELATFWDSSAIIKWYLDEDGSQVATKWFTASRFRQTAALSHAEVLAALARLRRENYLSDAEFQRCHAKFSSDFARLYVIEYSAPVRAIAAELCKQVHLRGADLVQLASAIKLSREGLPLVVITFDLQLANAARDAGLKVEGAR